MIKRPYNQMKLPIIEIVGFSISIIVTTVAAFVLASEGEKTTIFWHRLLWIYFLIAFNFSYFLNFSFKLIPWDKDKTGWGGIIPGAGILITFFSAISLLLILSSIYMPKDSFVCKNEFKLQFIFLGITLLLLITLFVVKRAALTGTEELPNGIKSPKELNLRLKLLEDKRFSNLDDMRNIKFQKNLKSGIKALREKFLYSLQNCGSIGQNPKYLDLTFKLNLFIEKINDIDLSVPSLSNEELFVNSLSELNEMMTTIDIIASSQTK